MGTHRRWYYQAVAVYDRVFRVWHALDRPAAVVPPALRVESRRAYRTIRLSDGTVIRAGDRVGALHLDNERVAALHQSGRSPLAIGLEFRRLLLTSLETLAAATAPGGWLAGVAAFVVVTIFHRGLPRLGFETDPNGLAWPRLTASYQRALVASLHPKGVLRLPRLASIRAERLWISRDRLLALYREGRPRPRRIGRGPYPSGVTNRTDRAAAEATAESSARAPSPSCD